MGLSMDNAHGWQITIVPGGQSILGRFGLDVRHVFDDPRIQVWRDLHERQNAFLERPGGTEGPARLHIKRYKAPFGPDAAVEARAIGLLIEHAIPTVPLVAWGMAADGRGFLITSDLTGLVPADRAIGEGMPADRLLPRVAALAARLHTARLHHRDLYLCHFFVHPAQDDMPLHLIDPGRVARLPAFPLDLRWIIKDLAQLCYSLREADLTAHEPATIDAYFREAKVPCPSLIRLLLPLKIASIARHDRRMQQRGSQRRVSIPG